MGKKAKKAHVKRLREELKEIDRHPLPLISVVADEPDAKGANKWKALINGPEGTPYFFLFVFKENPTQNQVILGQNTILLFPVDCSEAVECFMIRNTGRFE